MALAKVSKGSSAGKAVKRKRALRPHKSAAGKTWPGKSGFGAGGDVVRGYAVKGDAASLLSKMKKLPRGASVVIITENPEAEAEIKVAAKGALGRYRYFKRTPAKSGLPKGPASPLPADGDAFVPDARARALHRGRRFALEDLRAAGGAFDVDEVRELLHGVSRQALDKRVSDGRLLAVPGPSNRRRFPTVQFKDDGAVVEGLKDVQRALGFSSPWSVLNFLVNPHDDLGGDKPIERLRRGDLDPVVEAARRVGVQGA